MNRIRFLAALFTAIIYEMLIRLINPFGMSSTKVVLTLLVWISCYLAISTFFSEYQQIKNKLPKSAFSLFILVIVWNFFSIFRSALFGHGPVTTLLGNNETSLALLVPFCLVFSMDKNNLKVINKFFSGLIVIGLIAFLFFFISLKERANNYFYYKAFSVVFYGVFFLIPLIPFQLPRIRFCIFLGSIVLSYLAVVTGYRIIILRIPILYFSIIVLYLYRISNRKAIVVVAMLSLCLPFYFLIESVVTGESAFQKYRPESKDADLTDDTRTFLYTEVYADLKENNELVIGKGSSEPYYSPYFDQYGGDTSERLSVEVGILALFLKGGFIGVILNLAIFFIAIFLALFCANNNFVRAVGFMLIIHVLILFITNYIDYTIYNVALWFFVGVCLSKEIRSFSDFEIKNILHFDKSKT